MTTKLELGNQVFWDLGQEFVSTVFGAAKTGRSSVTCGVPSSSEGGIPMSRFFLNPFAEGECAGVDLVGKSIIARNIYLDFRENVHSLFARASYILM